MTTAVIVARPDGRATTRLEAVNTTAQVELRRGLTVAAMIAIEAAAALLRLANLNVIGFNSDEAVYAGQAASIAGDPAFTPYFPVFRAHPLLFQSIVSLAYRDEVSDGLARAISASFGLATVLVVFLLGSFLYGRRVGLLSALVIAVMPYHVVVTRQFLLDGPMVLFSTLALYLLARFALSGRALWLLAAAGGMGLAVLTKETSILLIGAVYAFLAATPDIRVRARQLVAALLVFGGVVAAFPMTLRLSGVSRTGEQFLAWQLFRRPNHDLAFYPLIVPPSVGLLVIAFAGAGLWMFRASASWRERLLLCWVAVPVLFFEAWPVKGFQYLLPAAPPLAVLAARAVVMARYDGRLPSLFGRRAATVTVIAVLTASLAIPSWQSIRPSRTGTFLAGSGGVPGGRETGRWLADHVPKGARLLAIGPSMANIVQFYGHRKSFGLSVSPNPLHRNPSYEPVTNPDMLIRSNELQYLVWDSFSADRTPFFSRKLLRYAERYHGRIVHTESVMTKDRHGRSVQKPIIVVYEVRP